MDERSRRDDSDANAAGAEPATAAAASSGEPVCNALSALEPVLLQQIASFLPLNALAALVCSSARVRACIGWAALSPSAAPVPFPALSRAPSYAWPALARSPALRMHVVSLVLPRSPRGGTHGHLGMGGVGAGVASLDEAERTMLRSHFPALTELRSHQDTRGAEGSVQDRARLSPVDLHFAANIRELDRMQPLSPLPAPPPPPSASPSSRSRRRPAPAVDATSGASAAAASLDATAAAASSVPLQVDPGSASDDFAPPPQGVTTPSALALLAAAASPIDAFQAPQVDASPGDTGDPAASAPPGPSLDHEVKADSEAAKREEEEEANESEPGSMVLHADSDNDDDVGDELSAMIGRASRSPSPTGSCSGSGTGSGAERDNEAEDADADADGEEEENSVIMNADRPDLDVAPDTPPRSPLESDAEGEGDNWGRGAHRPPSSLSPAPAVGALSRPGSARRSRAGGPNGERPRVSFAGVDFSASARPSVSVSSVAATAAQQAPSRSPRSLTGNSAGAGVDQRQQGSFSALALPSAAITASGTGTATGAAGSVGVGGTSPSLSSSSLSPSDQGGGGRSGSGGGGGGGGGSFSSARSSAGQTRADLLASFGAQGGPLTIVLLGARNLRLHSGSTDGTAASGMGTGTGASEDQRGGGGGGLPDPYISLTATWAPRKKYKSSVQKQSSHPMFNQKFTLQVPAAPASALAAAVRAVNQAQAQAQAQAAQQAQGTSRNGPVSVSGMEDSTMSFSLSTRDSTIVSAALRNATAASAATAAAGTGGSATTAPAAQSSAASTLLASGLCGGGERRAVRFRVYHKHLLGKRLLGEAVLGLQELLELAAMQRDVWVPLRAKGKSALGGGAGATAGAGAGADAPGEKGAAAAAAALAQPPRLSQQRRSVSQSLDCTAPAASGALLSGALSSPAVDRGDLHLIVTVDPLSFAAMLKGLAGQRGPLDSPPTRTRASLLQQSQEGERDSFAPMQLPAAATASASAATAADAVTRNLNGAAGEQRTLIRRRSRSDAGLSSSSAPAAPEVGETASAGANADDKTAQQQQGLPGQARRVGPSAAEQARNPSASPQAQGGINGGASTNSGSPSLTPTAAAAASTTPTSRRAISMDLSSPADVLSRRRSLLAPVIAGDTPEHSAASTPRGGTGGGGVDARGLNSSESSIMMLHNHSVDSVFTTPQKKPRSGGGEGDGGGASGGVGVGISPGLSAIRPGPGSSPGSTSKLLLSAGGSVASASGLGATGSGLAAAATGEAPFRSPSLSPGHFRSVSLQQTLSPRVSTLEGVDEGAGGEREQDQQRALQPPPQRRALSAPQSPLVLPAPSMSAALGSNGRPAPAAATFGPKSSPTAPSAGVASAADPDRGPDVDGDSGSEDDFDDTILWSPEEQRRRETRFREKIARLRRGLRDQTQEAALLRRQLERRDEQHAAAIKEAHAATIAAQTALAAAQSAAVPPAAAPVSARLETLLREADRKLAAQSTELAAAQTALTAAKAAHARELDVLRGRLMHSAAESAAFAAFKKSSALFVSSLRGASEAQLLQLQALGARLDAADAALRDQAERHRAARQRHRARITALAEQLEQSDASLCALQGRHQSALERAEQLAEERTAAAAQAAQLAADLRRERALHQRLSSDLNCFSARSGLAGGVELVGVLREAALARDQLAALSRRRQEEERAAAEKQSRQREADQLRAAHAELQRREAEQRDELEALRRERAALIELLQAEVRGKAAAAGAGGSTGQGPALVQERDGAMPAPQSPPAPNAAAVFGPPLWASPDGPQREGAAAAAGSAAITTPMQMPMPVPLRFGAAAGSPPLNGATVQHSSGSEFAVAAALPMDPAASDWSSLSLSLAAARQKANGPPAPSPFLALPFKLGHTATTNGDGTLALHSPHCN